MYKDWKKLDRGTRTNLRTWWNTGTKEKKKNKEEEKEEENCRKSNPDLQVHSLDTTMNVISELRRMCEKYITSRIHNYINT
jgi:hypothetical protein